VRDCSTLKTQFTYHSCTETAELYVSLQFNRSLTIESLRD